MRCGGGVFHSNAAHRGDAPAPTRPRKGRAIAYGIFESFPPLGLWPICFPDRHSRNRIENKTESKLVRRLCLEQRRWPQQTDASSRISICDSPALAGRVARTSEASSAGWGSTTKTVRVDPHPGFASP